MPLMHGKRFVKPPLQKRTSDNLSALCQYHFLSRKTVAEVNFARFHVNRYVQKVKPLCDFNLFSIASIFSHSHIYHAFPIIFICIYAPPY